MIVCGSPWWPTTKWPIKKKKRLQESVDFHESLHRAQLRLFDYATTNLTSRGSTWDGTCDDDWDREDLMTKIFGFPDEETLLQLLQNESQQPVVKTSDVCPNVKALQCHELTYVKMTMTDFSTKLATPSNWSNKLTAIFSQTQILLIHKNALRN